MRILVAQLNPVVGDLPGNAEKILVTLDYARSIAADGVLFSELALCGYPPEDLLLMPHFIDAAEETLATIVGQTKGLFAVIGTVRRSAEGSEKPIHNSAAIIDNGKLLGFHDKQLLPTYDVFSEMRYFEPGTECQIWELGGKRVGVTVCEDIWGHTGSVAATLYRNDPVDQLGTQKPDLVLNLSSSPFDSSKMELRSHVVSITATNLGCPVVQCNQVGGNDSLVFSGQSLYVGSDGELRKVAAGFEEDLMQIDTDAVSLAIEWERDASSDLYDALVLGVKDYFRKQGFQKACLGVSGGVDSALVAALAVEALGAENITGVIMPSRYTSDESMEDARLLVERLGIKSREIAIEGPFEAFLDLMNPHFDKKDPDATEENLQARIRGMILMALSNKHGDVVLSTGNKSELAMGYSTLYGDMAGGLAVINDLTKEQVYDVCEWINRNDEVIPSRILRKAPSAELRPDQKDTDSLPEYPVVDRVLQLYVEEHQSAQQIATETGYELNLVQDLVRRIHLNEYKRRQGAPGLRVTKRAFSIGRRFPIVQRWRD